jgi:hypothetical protein
MVALEEAPRAPGFRLQSASKKRTCGLEPGNTTEGTKRASGTMSHPRPRETSLSGALAARRMNCRSGDRHADLRKI